MGDKRLLRDVGVKGMVRVKVIAEIEGERLLYVVRMGDKRLSHDVGVKGMVNESNGGN